MKNVTFVLMMSVMIVFCACSHNNNADVTEKGKVVDTIKGNPTFTNNQIHSNASSVSGAGSVIINPGDVKIINSKWNKNLSDTAMRSQSDRMTRAFENYFRMSSSTMRYIRKSDYTSAKWDSMMVAELISGRPTYYGDIDVCLDYHSVWYEDPMTNAFRSYFKNEAAKKNQWNPFTELPVYCVYGDSTPYVWSGCMATPIGQIMKHH